MSGGPGDFGLDRLSGLDAELGHMGDKGWILPGLVFKGKRSRNTGHFILHV